MANANAVQDKIPNLRHFPVFEELEKTFLDSSNLNPTFSTTCSKKTSDSKDDNSNIGESIIDRIGKTPQQFLPKIAKHNWIRGKILAKLEFLNPNETIYDRLALALINKIESLKLAKPGNTTLIFGFDPEFCLALHEICRIKSYRLLSIIPESSLHQEIYKQTLVNFGGRVCPIEEKYFFEEVEQDKRIEMLNEIGYSMAKSCCSNIENSVNLLEFVKETDDAFNSGIDALMEEIFEIKLVPNVLIAENDSLGVLNRIVKNVKEKWESCQIFGVDSPFKASNCTKPVNLPQENIVSVSDREVLRMARDLNKKEHLGGGERSGAVLAGIMKVFQKLRHEKRDSNFLVLCILPDGCRYSEKKFLNVEYMNEKASVSEAEKSMLYWWFNNGTGNLKFILPPLINSKTSVLKAAEMSKDHPQILVWQGENSKDAENVVGVVTNELYQAVIEYRKCKEQLDEMDNSGKYTLAERPSFMKCHGMLSCQSTFGELYTLFEKYPFVLIYNEITLYTKEGEIRTYKTALALSKIEDIQDWIFSVEEHHRKQFGLSFVYDFALQPEFDDKSDEQFPPALEYLDN